MGPIQTLDELKRWLFRRAGLILLVTTVFTVAGILFALSSDRVYRASAVLQVQNIIPSGTVSAPASSTSQRIQTIEQQMMSRENLLALGERHGVFDGTNLTPSERHQLMRQSISIEAVSSMPGGFQRDGSLSALIVSASAASPEVAAAMANEIAGDLVQENTRSRRLRAEASLQFYRSEEARIEDQITAIEAEIAAFQVRNEDAMPGSLALRRDELARLSETRMELQREINEARSEVASLDPAGRGVTQRRAAQLTELIGRRNAEVMEINAQVEAIQALFQRGSELEVQVNALNRRMATLQGQLDTIIDRRREAEITSRLEGDDQTERFELLDPALPPDYPVSRSRTLLVAVAGLAGGMAGLALAYMIEWIRPVLRSATMFERELQLRPVITLPYQLPPRERRRRQLIWLGGLGILALGVGGLAVATGLI